MARLGDLINGILLVSLISCGKVVEIQTDNRAGFIAPVYSESPAFLVKQYEQCSSSFAKNSDFNFTINRYFNNLIQAKTYDFKEQMTGNFIGGPDKKGPIRKAYYGLESVQVVDLNYDTETELYLRGKPVSQKTEREAIELEVCPQTNEFASDSYENAGLNISQNITKTYGAIKDADPSVELAPVDIFVGSIHKEKHRFIGGKYDKRQLIVYKTDNASYYPSRQAIEFLPHSKNYKKLYGEAVYYNIPMVASHEYGHHVFRSLLQGSDQAVGLSSESCFQTKHNHQVVSSTDTEATRDNTKSFILMAANEGFADLLAYYTQGKEMRGLEGAGCLEDKREVDEYKTGSTYKVFSDLALSAINSEVEFTFFQACNNINFQAIHDVGAVFAYSVNHLVSKYIQSDKNKLKVALTWVKTLKNGHGDKEVLAGDYLFKIIERYYQIALDQAGVTVSNEHCLDLDAVFPGNHGYKCKLLVTK